MISLPNEQESDGRHSSPLRNASSTLTRELRDKYGIAFPSPPEPMTNPEIRVESILDPTVGLNGATVIDDHNTSVMGSQPHHPAQAGIQRPPQRHNITVEDVHSDQSDTWSKSSENLHDTKLPGTNTTPPPTSVRVYPKRRQRTTVHAVGPRCQRGTSIGLLIFVYVDYGSRDFSME